MHHGGDVVDVDAAGGHVGGNQHRQRAVGELGERALAGRLRHVAVQRVGLHVEFLQRLRHLVAQSLGVAEHHGLAGAGGDRGDDAVFVHAVHRQKEMSHRADGGSRRIDRHFARVVHVATHEIADLAVERGGKEHRLVRRGHLAQHPLHLGHESFVGHAVGLVDHHDLHVRERELLFFQQVDEAKRGGDHEFDALLQRRDLVVARGAAVHRQHPAFAVSADRLEHLGHLQGQLAGRHEHQAARGAGRGRRVDSGQHRHAERQRLARPGAGPAAQVDARQSHGNRLGLDGERSREAGGGEPGIHTGGHTECCKLGGERHDFVPRYLRGFASLPSPRARRAIVRGGGLRIPPRPARSTPPVLVAGY